MDGRPLLPGVLALALITSPVFSKTHKASHAVKTAVSHTASQSVEDAAWAGTAASKGPKTLEADDSSDVTEPTVTLHSAPPPAPITSPKTAFSSKSATPSAASKTKGTAKGLSKKEAAKAQADQRRQEAAQRKSDRAMQRNEAAEKRREQTLLKQQQALQVREARYLIAAQRRKAK